MADPDTTVPDTPRARQVRGAELGLTGHDIFEYSERLFNNEALLRGLGSQLSRNRQDLILVEQLDIVETLLHEWNRPLDLNFPTQPAPAPATAVTPSTPTAVPYTDSDTEYVPSNAGGNTKDGDDEESSDGSDDNLRPGDGDSGD